jgi:hypothetical protein
MNEGDIYLYKRTAKTCFGSPGLPDGVPVVITHVRKNDDGEPIWLGLRVARNLTALRAWPDQVEAFPADLSIEEAQARVFEFLYGPKAKSVGAKEAEIYKKLLSEGQIPPVEEGKVVRLEPRTTPTL